jgi:hypothetical protein
MASCQYQVTAWGTTQQTFEAVAAALNQRQVDSSDIGVLDAFAGEAGEVFSFLIGRKDGAQQQKMLPPRDCVVWFAVNNLHDTVESSRRQTILVCASHERIQPVLHTEDLSWALNLPQHGALKHAECAQRRAQPVRALPYCRRHEDLRGEKRDVEGVREGGENGGGGGIDSRALGTVGICGAGLEKRPEDIIETSVDHHRESEISVGRWRS